MKKKYFILASLIIIFILFIYLNFGIDNNVTKGKIVVYNAKNLLISIDGNSSETLPTSGNYYLVDYDCKNKNTKLIWDRVNHKLKVSNKNKKAGVACNLEFKSQPLLSEMPVGSYIDYTGVGGKVGNTTVNCKINSSASSSTETAETAAPNSCLGQNAREDLDNSNYTYGYCYNDTNKFFTTGWRIAYIDNDKAVIVSAGSPECNNRKSGENGNKVYIKKANSLALKYCNSEFVDGNCSCLDSDSDGYCDCTDSDSDGLCDEIENNQVDAWAISDVDFYNMTKAISGVGKRLTDSSSGLGDKGGILGTTLYCYDKYSYRECGYNNDLIDNGGMYWFAARNSSTGTYGVAWYPEERFIYSSSITESAFGLRPVISLSSTVVVTGGDGTMESPYEIANNTFSVNEVSGGFSFEEEEVGSSNDKEENISVTNKRSVKLSLVSGSDVSTMCINVNSSGCSNYIDFSDSYVLDLSNELDGKKNIYVYYKNKDGKVISSLIKSFVLDTIAPRNSSVSIDSDGSINSVLTLKSEGAKYMCFSNTSSNVNNCTDWVDYKTSYNWKLSNGDGDKTVYAFFMDKAGNISDVVSDTISIKRDCLDVNKSESLGYTGFVVNSDELSVKLCDGTYKLELWGAQGGNNGGNGGYSRGDITLDGTEKLYFYVGGAGSKGKGGFNGGGTTGSTGGGGGGATDVRLGSDSLLTRVIVAGGGGGSGYDTCALGGAGGGITGIGGTNQSSCGVQGGAGSQDVGGIAGIYNDISGANSGQFGIGGNASDSSYDGGAGGGGWYGGGSGVSHSWTNGGGGGSGFVYTSSSILPDGYLVSSDYYLENATTIDGTKNTIPTISGNDTEIGHTGNGYIKITRLS